MRILTIIGLALLFFCGLMIALAGHIRYQARMLVEDLARLDSTADPIAYFSEFKGKHHHQFVHEECQSEFCQYEFVVTNHRLSWFGIPPRTELTATISVFRHQLDFAGIEYTSGVRTANRPVLHVQEDFCSGRGDISCDHFALNPHGRMVGPSWNGIVEFGQLASSNQKRAAWNLNLACFTAFHGCKDITQLSSRLWVPTGAGLVSSCLRSSSDSNAELSAPLSDSCRAN